MTNIVCVCVMHVENGTSLDRFFYNIKLTIIKWI